MTAPASTGITAISRYAVISQDHTNSGMRSRPIPGARMFMIVTITLMAPRIDEAPMRWIAKITIGNDSLPCRTSGGYNVQPPAGPPPGTKIVQNRIVNANGRIQKEKLFRRGSAMSGAPTCSGICQLARPVQAGITAPKIMNSACMVVIAVEEHRVDELQTRLEQLGADDHGHRAADEEHQAREHQVHRADVLVIRGVNPAAPAVRLVIVVCVVAVCAMAGGV